MSGDEKQEPLPGRKPNATYPPPWYTPSKARVTLNLRVARGLHPTGRALGPEGSTCGACRSLVLRYPTNRKAFPKCELDRRFWTAGLATDLAQSWRGCASFVAKEGA